MNFKFAKTDKRYYFRKMYGMNYVAKRVPRMHKQIEALFGSLKFISLARRSYYYNHKCIIEFDTRSLKYNLYIKDDADVTWFLLHL
jgi:hypothetical protein